MRINHFKSEYLGVADCVRGTSWLDEYPTNLVVQGRSIRKMNPGKDLFFYWPHRCVRVHDRHRGGGWRNWDLFYRRPRLIKADSELPQTLVTDRPEVHRDSAPEDKEEEKCGQQQTSNLHGQKALFKADEAHAVQNGWAYAPLAV
jgi:hypothetical protein